MHVARLRGVRTAVSTRRPLFDDVERHEHAPLESGLWGRDAAQPDDLARSVVADVDDPPAAAADAYEISSARNLHRELPARVQKMRRVSYAPMQVNELRQLSGRVRRRGNAGASVVVVLIGQAAEEGFESGLLRIVEAPLVDEWSIGAEGWRLGYGLGI